MCTTRHLGTLLGGALLALALAAGGAQANPAGHSRDTDRANEQTGETIRQQYITISTENGEIQIRSVVVLTDTREILAALTDTGVRMEDTDKVDLSGMPVIGGLFGGKEKDADELVPIGNVHILGPTLAIDLRSPPPTTFVVDLPETVVEDRKIVGQSMDSKIREILELRPPDMQLIHHLQGSEYLLDSLQVRQETSRQTLARLKLGRVGLFGAPAPQEPLDQEVAEKIKEFERLFGEPFGTAYLDEPNLAVVIEPLPRE